MGMQVHQCPRCELRFLYATELRDHLGLDHGADPETFERYRYAPRSARGADVGASHHLIVANQTLVGDQLERAVLERARRGPARFSVLVPATHSAHQPIGPDGSGDRTPEVDESDDAGLALARWRMRTAIDRLAALGIHAEGQVGHADPVRAVLRFLPDQAVDEILVSTLPAGISRWLALDLPGHLQRRTGIPVTTLRSELAGVR